jgi:hypothetical protein
VSKTLATANKDDPMTTTSKIQANRQNALLSTGPKSVEGKAVVSGNAIRHGLLSWKPTIPGLENADEWEAHLERIMESLAPMGYMETVLAERIALLLWRLGRVCRYEREVIAVSEERTEIDWTSTRPYSERGNDQSPLEIANSKIESVQANHKLATNATALPPETKVDRKAAANLLSTAAYTLSVELYEGRIWPSYANGIELSHVNWTAARFLECLRIVAQSRKYSVEDVLMWLGDHTKNELAQAQAKLKAQRDDLDRFHRSLLLPSRKMLEKLSRYETTLERSLFKALHELERRQAARDGQTVPLPVAVDVNLSGPAQE